MTIEKLKQQLDSIQEQIKQLESAKLKVGDYIIAHDDYGVAKITKLDPMGYYWDSIQGVLNGMSFFENCRPATESEILEALKNEAIKRGFKEGVRIERTNHFAPNVGKAHLTMGGLGYKYVKELDRLEAFGSAVYEKGQWATIIGDTIKIGVYEVKFVGNHTTIDGYDFSKVFWQSAKTISEHSKAKIMVGCSKQFDVSLEIINQILNRL